jgi:hypothetical protein
MRSILQGTFTARLFQVIMIAIRELTWVNLIQYDNVEVLA